MPDLILSLFDSSGVWSRPYEAAGYDVVRIDLSSGLDVRWFKKVPSVRGVLSAPPCGVFAGSGAQYWKTKDLDGRTLDGLALVDATFRIIMVHSPKWWALENPIGRLSRWIGKPALVFHPYEYGDPYKKRTCLWGNFTVPVRNVVEPVSSYSQGSWVQGIGGTTKDREQRRSVTPAGFAQAFFEANP